MVAPINFKFVAATGGMQIKQNLYPLVPITDNTTNNKGKFAATGIKFPMVPGGVSGKFFAMPLYIASSSDPSVYIDLEEAVISITKSKKIVSTEIVGGNGTIKEFIGDNDMNIDIAVGIVATDEAGNIIDEYPTDGVRALRELLDKREALKISSEFFEVLDLGAMFYIVVTEYSITQQTHSNRQTVKIKAVSDYDYTIYSEEA
ncbi:MAG: DUF6046 domain-containing protein [Prevotellaceae bacterium]|jgi:hypothetical protein|nr:DUF6046 domain-containing protein [Prevotellaceae bacterium]